MILPCALLLSQCAPTPPAAPTPPQAAAPVAFSSHHWVRVSPRPPTFYPRGVAADTPTDLHSGEWVYTKDDRDTRFFIPFRGCGGVPRETLVNEAMAARSEKKMRQIAAEDRQLRNNRVAGTVVGIPLFWATTIATGGLFPYFLDPAGR